MSGGGRQRGADGGVESLTIGPPAGEWAGLVDHHWRGRNARTTDLFRREMGLPVDRPIIMTGHQAQVSHPGILAKHIAAAAAARAAGAAAVWITVDQDDNDPFEIRFPMRRPGDRVMREMWPARPGRDPAADAPTGLRPSVRFFDQPLAGAGGEFALPSVGDGLRRIRAAMLVHSSEPCAARQVGAATADLAAPWAAATGIVYATDLSRTTLFADLLGAMRNDPRRCADAYNHAVASHSDAGVQMLVPGGRGVGPELPLWRLRRSADRAWRERVHGGGLGQIPLRELAPRALLMTALLRLGGCDLFVHGTGAGGEDGYDRIMERWIGDWLGAEKRAALAPAATVSATLRLPIGVEPVSLEQAARATWLAHHARHDPSLLGDAGAAAAKRALVDQIGAARRAGLHPRAEFARLHTLLDDVRSRHGAKLGDLAAQAAHLRNRRDDAGVIADRTWPFPLYPGEQLDALRHRIDGEFAPRR